VWPPFGGAGAGCPAREAGLAIELVTSPKLWTHEMSRWIEGHREPSVRGTAFGGRALRAPAREAGLTQPRRLAGQPA
jgi:hypothetical protein